MTNIFGKIVSKVNAKEEIKKRLPLKKVLRGTKPISNQMEVIFKTNSFLRRKDV